MKTAEMLLENRFGVFPRFWYDEWKRAMEQPQDVRGELG